jgi:hypothetical protein
VRETPLDEDASGGRARARARASARRASVSVRSWLTFERRLDLLAGGIVLAGYAIVQLVLLRGPRPFDPAVYWAAGVDFPHVDANLLTLRIGLVAPVKAAVLAFGPSEAALYTVPLATGLVLAAAVFGTMLLLFGDRVLAAAAALVVALNAYYLLNSSFIFPDPAATAAFTAGVFFLVLGAARSGEQGSGRIGTVSLGCAGVLFGWAYLIREFSPVLLPTVIAAFVLLRYRARQIPVLAGAALATFCLEPLYGLLRYGDPFVHAGWLLGRGDVPVTKIRLARIEQVQEQLNDPLDTVQVFPRLLVSWHVGWVFLFFVALFIAALVRTRDRRLWLFAAWCFGFWAVMALLGLGSLSSGRWIVNITNIRYWSPIFPALVMGGFASLFLLVPKSLPSVRGLTVTHAAAAFFVTLALVPGVVQYRRCAAMNVWPSDPIERWHDLRSWFATPEAQRYDVIWTDRNTGRYISAFSSTTFGKRLWSGAVEWFGRGGAAVPATRSEGSLLLINKDEFRYPKALSELRTDWSPVFVTSDGAMVVLALKSAGAEPVENETLWTLPKDRSQSAAARTCKMQPYSPTE